MRSARRLLLAASAATVILVAAGPATPATSPPVVGTWRWADADEALINPRNPTVLRVRARGRASFEARFGRGTWVPVTWTPGTRRFAFTAPRRVGRAGERRAPVAYRGRLILRQGTWRAQGTLRIILRGYRGVSGFTAVRRG